MTEPQPDTSTADEKQPEGPGLEPEISDSDAITARRQPGYDAVFAYIRSTNRVPGDVVTRNAMIWRGVAAALDALNVGCCISSHCVEGDHVLVLDAGAPMPEPTPDLIHACPTCGPTATEPHPRLPIDRCSNCKEHIAPGAAQATTSDGVSTGPERPADSAPRCTCGHTKGDHSGRRDHREKYPNIPHRPWCHACETECIYCPPDDVPAPAPEPGLREQVAAAIRYWWDDDDQGAAEIADAVLAVRDAELQQLRAELSRCRARFATQAENGAALALDLGAAEAALARVREFADQDQDGLCCSHVTGELRTLLKSLAPQDPS